MRRMTVRGCSEQSEIFAEYGGEAVLEEHSGREVKRKEPMQR